MKNLDWLKYTYKHRRTIEYLIEKLDLSDEMRVEMRKRALTHDVDKMIMYIFLPQNYSQNYHVMHQPHHLDNDLEKNFYDYLETVIDFESAPYTKPDKPLNAFDFTNKCVELGWIKTEDAKILYDIMHTLKIDYSYDSTKNHEVMSFVNSIGEITEEMILQDIFEHSSSFTEEINMIKEKKNEWLK